MDPEGFHVSSQSSRKPAYLSFLSGILCPNHLEMNGFFSGKDSSREDDLHGFPR